MKFDFRRVLKEATRPDHELTDGVMSEFDLRTRAGLSEFLAVHHLCFKSMVRSADAQGETCRAMAQMLGLIENDLSTLGADLPTPPHPDARKLDPLALDYVFEGSRMGTKVLRRDWSAAQDPAVRRASAYFTSHAPASRWQDVCQQLSEIDPNSARADRIVADTRTLFALFRKAAQPDEMTPQELTA
jgi:heme oxygenase